MSSSNNKFAVIGLGNTLRKDDGVGIFVLRELAQKHKLKNSDYLDFGTCSIDLINRFGSYRKAVLIDGIDGGLEGGRLKIFDLKDAEYILGQSPVSTHEINLAGLFFLCGKLAVKTEIHVAGIQVKETGFGEGLSEALKRDFSRNVNNIAIFAENLFASGKSGKKQ